MVENRPMLGNSDLCCRVQPSALCLIACFLIAPLISTQVHAQEAPTEQQAADAAIESEDETDSDEEEKKPLVNKGNFLALPIFITEPAIGEGLGVGLVYFHKKKDPNTPRISTASAMSQTNRQQNPPPTATGVLYL